MIIASKIWDDNSFENTHFSQVFANLGVSEINTLERIFLELIIASQGREEHSLLLSWKKLNWHKEIKLGLRNVDVSYVT